MSDLVFVDDMPEVAEMRQRIAALEAENARLTAERETIQKAGRVPEHFKHGLAAWINLLTASSEEAEEVLGDYGHEITALQSQLQSMTAERDAARNEVGRLKIEVYDAKRISEMDDDWVHHYVELTMDLERRLSKTLAALKGMKEQRNSETRWAKHYHDAWQTARQSRARLVRLVRTLRAQLTTAWGIEAQAQVAALKQEQSETKDLHEAFSVTLDQLRDAKAQVAALKAVVEAVEWVGPPHTSWWNQCAWCKKPYGKHAPDCARQIALKGGE